MTLFRLIRGMHVEGGPEDCACDRCINDRRIDTERAIAKKAKRKPTISMSKRGHIYRPGDIIDSPSDLVRKYNSEGSIKFELVDATGRTVISSKRSAANSTSTEQESDGLEGLSITELRAIASEEEVALDGATRKEDIIRLIRASTVPTS